MTVEQQSFFYRFTSLMLRKVLLEAPQKLLYIMYLSIKRFFHDKRLLWAASLTYTTIFSLVPLLSVVFSLFKVFGGLSDFQGLVRPYIYKTIAPGAQEKAITTLNNLVESINFSTIGALGTGVLIIAVILLLSEMEYALNEIWVTRNRRPLFYRIAMYWTSLTVGPLLLAVSLVIMATLQSSNALKIVEAYINIDLFSWLPYFLVWIAFTGLYIFMPGARVRIPAALTGGFIAGTLWQLAGKAFTIYTTQFVFYYPLVYGPLSAIPVFLLWVFISWMLFLLGAEIAYHYDHYSFYQTVSHPVRLNYEDREHLTLRMLLFIARRYLRSLPPPSLQMIAEELRIPLHLTEELTLPLRAGGILFESSHQQRTLVFGRDVRTITVAEILNMVRCDSSLPPSYHADAVGRFLQQNIHTPYPREAGGIGAKNLTELLREVEPELHHEGT
jgi:membrane protein